MKQFVYNRKRMWYQTYKMGMKAVSRLEPGHYVSALITYKILQRSSKRCLYERMRIYE